VSYSLRGVGGGGAPARRRCEDVRNSSKAIVGILLGVTVGCSSDYAPRYVERVPVAGPGARNTRPYETERSAGLGRDVPPESPFYNEAMAGQRTAEQASFEQAYRAVGRPRIMVFVGRSAEGGAKAPGDVQVGSIDDTVVENVLTDLLACQGAVDIVSPTVVRQRLAEAQARVGQANRLQAMRDVAQQLETDVLVYVTAQPTGPEARLVGEAVNVKGGQQIGRAVVEIPPPLEKGTLNRYTRLVARKLMMDMTQNWMSPEGPTTRPPAGPVPERPATPGPETK
jgi:hypothetical protein